MLLLLGLAFDAVTAWLLLRMLRQFRGYESIGPEHAAAGEWPKLAVIVPARNEAALIGRCLAGLLAQDYPFEALSLLLVDDNSEDGTAEIALRLAGADPRFRLIRGAPLPPGWTGKPFACQQGADAAEAEWLCFMDADTQAAPALLRAATAQARRRGLDMLSLEPFQELETWPERLVVPCGFYLIAASQDLGRVNDPAAPEAVANGQFILIRRAAYGAIGGHAAVRTEFSEDTALARLVKRAGFRLAVLGAERLIRTRMYRGWRSVWHGVSKNAVDIAGGVAPTLLIAGGGLAYALAALGLTGLAAARLLAGPSGSNVAGAALLAAGLVAVLGLHVAGARHFRIPIRYGLAFPAGYMLAFALALNSARLALRGRIPWKGRVYGEGDGANALRPSGPRGR